MTYQILKMKLYESTMFSTREIDQIIKLCGTATMGAVIVACQIIDIELTAGDIDRLFNL